MKCKLSSKQRRSAVRNDQRLEMLEVIFDVAFRTNVAQVWIKFEGLNDDTRVVELALLIETLEDETWEEPLILP